MLKVCAEVEKLGNTVYMLSQIIEKGMCICRCDSMRQWRFYGYDISLRVHWFCFKLFNMINGNILPILFVYLITKILSGILTFYIFT